MSRQTSPSEPTGLNTTTRRAFVRPLRHITLTLSGVSLLVCFAATPTLAKGPFAKPKKAAPATAAAPAAKPPAAASAEATPELPQIVAVVNGTDVTLNDLSKQCLWQFGKEVLEGMVNRSLIVARCTQQKVEISRGEIDAEIDRLAERFGVPKDQWLKMLEQERNITPAQYAEDVVWPTLALRKLAGDRLEVTPQEIREAYESQFGAAVKVRLIACNTLDKAKKVLAEAQAAPDEFGNLAKQYSDDVNSASAKGLIQPIRRHLGDPALEEMAFALKPGDVSQIVQVQNQFVILKCEEHLPPRNTPIADVQPMLEESLRDRKLRQVASQVFQELQQQARVVNVYNDPAKSKQMPGVAALVNDRQVSLRELMNKCVELHGKEVLEGMIQRRLLEQECRQHQVEVTPQDIQAEIAHAAMAAGKINESGDPDTKGWLKLVQEEQGLSLELYVHDAIWPAAALKKLVAASITIEDEDLKRGFEANFGPRVRCRAIILGSQRKAQEVWQMARDNPTLDYFGDLAEQYSIDPTSRTLRGEVPPIQRWGGEPLLEQEAFTLKANELSSIIQVGDQYVILFCEGYTQPMQVQLSEVRDLLAEDIREKKLRIAMLDRFNQLKDAAQIDNYLAQTSQEGKAAARPGEPARVSLEPYRNAVPAAPNDGSADSAAARKPATARPVSSRR